MSNGQLLAVFLKCLRQIDPEINGDRHRSAIGPSFILSSSDISSKEFVANFSVLATPIVLTVKESKFPYQVAFVKLIGVTRAYTKERNKASLMNARY